jgi:NAD+ kinase
MLQKVAIYSSENRAKTREVIQRLIEEFCRKDIKIMLYENSDELRKCPGGMLIEQTDDLNTLSGLPDLVLSVGGDGTFLETMLKVKDLGIPVAGINTGRLGFLANISEEEINQSLDLLYNADYRIIERCLLEVTEPYDLFEGISPVALNEITIQKADLNMITINVFVDDTYLNTYWADGLIVSTAT